MPNQNEFESSLSHLLADSSASDGSDWQISEPAQFQATSPVSRTSRSSSQRSHRRTLLLVGDCAEDRALICGYLKGGIERANIERANAEDAYEILVAETGVEGLEICRTTLLDLILLAHSLPDLDAIAFLQAVRFEANLATLPIIMIAEQGHEALAVQLLRAGVRDYLIKGQFSAYDLRSSVERSIFQGQITHQAHFNQAHSNQASPSQAHCSLEKERLVSQIAQRIHRSLDLDTVLQTIVWEVRQFLQTDRVLVFKIDADMVFGQVVAEAVEAPWRALLSDSFQDPCFVRDYADAYRQGRVTAMADLHTAELEPCYWEFLNGLQVRANLVVPIVREHRLWGLMLAQHCRGPRIWEHSEIELLQQFSTQVGIALHRVELHQQVQQELTERQRTAQRLWESQEQLRLGVRVAGIALAKVDYAANTVELSPEAAALYGLCAAHSVNERVDKRVVSRDRLHATFHPDERSELLEIIRQVLEPSGAGWFERDHRIVWPTGETRWLSVRKQVFFAGSGASARPTYAVLAAIDITARKQADLERERLLSQEQAARTQAERANHIKDEFLAVLSHELRSPLNPILGWTNLLQKNKLDAHRTQQALATIERNAKLQAQLIDDLLDISRIMQGKLTLDTAAVDLAFVINAALETVRLAAITKNTHIALTLPDEPIQVMGDVGRLQQVVWNLLSNAIKFTPSGGQVDVVLSQSENQAQIQVSDTGKGITPAFLPDVFEHFRQEDGAITRKFGGLGLGLAIARQIVELHDGSIAVQSLGENQGATFTVKFPLLQNRAAAKLADSPAVAEANQQMMPLANRQVLVVDDDLDTREFLALLLAENGASVTVSTCASQALQALEHNRFDVLLSDIGMAEIDGYRLLRTLRSQTHWPNFSIPAVAITAYASELDQAQALAAGFQHHLAKPVDSSQLIALVTALI